MFLLSCEHYIFSGILFYLFAAFGADARMYAGDSTAMCTRPFLFFFEHMLIHANGLKAK
jgi:hypothetical protein